MSLPTYMYTTPSHYAFTRPVPLGVIPAEFRGDFWIQKTRVPGLSCGVVSVILCLAVLVEHQLVTDRQTHGHGQCTEPACTRAFVPKIITVKFPSFVSIHALPFCLSSPTDSLHLSCRWRLRHAVLGFVCPSVCACVCKYVHS